MNRSAGIFYFYFFSNFKYAILEYFSGKYSFYNTHLLVGRVLVSRTDNVG